MFATVRFTDSRRVQPRIPCKFVIESIDTVYLVLKRVSAHADFYRAVFVSFGGLLLYLEGPYKKVAPLRIDYVYLLLKK